MKLSEVDKLRPTSGFMYLISCDKCKTLNPDIENGTNYFCAMEGTCPGMSKDPIKRKILYLKQQDGAIRSGSAERIE